MWIWTLWAASNVFGIGVLALADDDERLVALGRNHGPSTVEALGALVVIVGWVSLDAYTLRLWPRSRWSVRAKRSAAALAMVGIGALVPAVVWGTGATWLVGAAMLGGIQLAAALSIAP
jgi:uncharacterized membrane protein YidH (DUF202 family)